MRIGSVYGQGYRHGVKGPMGEQGTFMKSSSIRYVSLHFGVVTKYLLRGLEVCTVSATDIDKRVRCVKRGYL